MWPKLKSFLWLMMRFCYRYAEQPPIEVANINLIYLIISKILLSHTNFKVVTSVSELGNSSNYNTCCQELHQRVSTIFRSTGWIYKSTRSLTSCLLFVTCTIANNKRKQFL